MQISPAIVALLQIVLIDLVLAGDNAVIIGMAASRVPSIQRRKVILWGMGAAVILRILLAFATTTIFATVNLMLLGGILLLWVSWRFYRDLNPSPEEAKGLHTISGREVDAEPRPALQTKELRMAIMRIMMADISMSLDNVLAVAGAAVNNPPWVLFVGLALSIALMGAAASVIANLLARHPWLSYAGLIIVLYVAIRMIVIGGMDLLHPDDQPSLSSKPVASSEVLNRGNAIPSGSPASISRSSFASAARPFAWAAAMSVSAS